MITKEEIKHIKSLQNKKFRDQYNEFIVEGEKCVSELLKSDLTIKNIFSTEDWNPTDNITTNVVKISPKELSRISSLKTPNKVIAVVEKQTTKIDNSVFENELGIVLCSLQNPGNLGTIIRTADWFGINNIICSSDSVDFHNPKVIQSAMGSIFRTKVHYCNLNDFLSQKEINNLPLYSAEIEGENLYTVNKTKNGLIIFGNESKGIPEDISKLANNKITIPSFGNATESLNVAIAAGIICSEFKRPNK